MSRAAGVGFVVLLVGALVGASFGLLLVAPPVAGRSVLSSSTPWVAPRPDNAGNSSNLSTNTSSQLGNSAGKFVHWFLATLLTIIEVSIAVLVAGGILNYVLVGRKRRPWSPPAQAPPASPGPDSASPASPSATGVVPGAAPVLYVRRKKPRLYRTARNVRWLSILATVLVIVFIVSTIYSVFLFATRGHIGFGHNPFQLNETSSGGIQATFAINITNPSYYTLVLDVSANIGEVGGPLISQSSTGAVTIAPNHQPTPLAMTVAIPTSALAASSAALLLHNSTLQGGVWINGSYATVYTFGLYALANDTWGAPFEGLTVQPGTPSENAGETTVPVELRFTDYSNFLADDGTLSLQVVTGGSDCGSPTATTLDAQNGQAYQTSFNVTGPSSCMTPGASIEITYTLDGRAIPLPTESLT